MHAAIYRPRELQGYLKTIQIEAKKIKALRDQLEAQFARVAKLEFVKYTSLSMQSSKTTISTTSR